MSAECRSFQHQIDLHREAIRNGSIHSNTVSAVADHTIDPTLFPSLSSVHGRFAHLTTKALGEA
eukprot:4943764-Karenia_brevis.AAC.1